MKYSLILITIGLLVGCQKAGETRGTVTDVTVPTVKESMPECNDSSGSTKECTSDESCCSGFYCGKHPDKSQRQNYCMYDPTNY